MLANTEILTLGQESITTFIQLDATVNTEASLRRLAKAILAELSDDWKPENDT